MSQTPVALRFEGVSKQFRTGEQIVPALKDVDLMLASGGVTGLLGPDGAGKTTLMRLAAGLLTPDQGRIDVLGVDALADPLEVQRRIGYMPQHFGLYEDLSVQENLDLYADLQGLPDNQRQNRYKELMHLTGLGAFTGRLAGKLSGGMKQKLGLACTLVRPPALLLLDEPTVGVDPVSRRELWQIVYREVEQQGMTVLLSTAYLDEADRCNDVVLLNRGEKIDQKSPQAFSDPLRGRVFEVRSKRVSHRLLQQRLLAREEVVDAVILSHGIRTVTHQGQVIPAQAFAGQADAVTVRPVEPRFGDAFIAILSAAGDAPQATENLGLAVKPGSDAVAIEVKHLERNFGAFQAVSDVSFSVRRGEIFGLLGANGAGKSTTFRMLCGLLPVSAGEARVAGEDLRNAPARARARIGYMAQKFSLYAHLSVRQNLEFFASAYGLVGGRHQQRVDWALESFQLAPHSESEAGDLSLGYKQRLAFAAALMHEPDILFLDEPTSGVDPLARREFWNRTIHLADSGVTVLVTTHFMEEANYCDRVVIMSDGKMLIEGSPDEVKQQAQTPDNPEPSMEDAFIYLIEQGSEGE